MGRSRAEFLDAPRRAQTETRACDQPGCACEGQFRAPRSRDQLGAKASYYWFCLDHVRAYNASWNYYAGMSDAEIEHELRHDTVWERPTWPLGWRVAGNRWRDPLHIFRADANEHQSSAEARHHHLSEDEKALLVFELAPPFELKDLKARYKVLVKMHHPDANGGSKEAEERLKIITRSYALLKTRYFG